MTASQPTAARPFAIRNVRLLDPESGYDAHGALLAEDGKITAMGPTIFGRDLFGEQIPAGAEVIDGGGHILCPGFIDMRVFTGEPGSEHRETLESASRAAAAGGVTTFVMMPDTDPIIDDAALVDFILRRALATASVRVLPAAALTRGLKGEAMTEFGLLQEAGAVMVTDATRAVGNALVMRRCLSYASNFDVLVAPHIDVPELAQGAANEGEFAGRMGLPGIPGIAEVIGLERDLRLLAGTGARYHAGQVSTAESLEVIRRARAQGLTISCAVSAHHLALNELDIADYKTFAKVHPPLRAEWERQALVEGVRDGTIDAIVSSHDPQATEAKRLPFAQAAFGAIGLETLLPASLGLYHNAGVALRDVLAKLTCGPANILRLPQGRLAPGAPADLVLFDPDAPVRIDPQTFHSHTKNSPFKGRLMNGRVLRTIVGGRQVYAAG
ncbi:MAG TPA: dihydroorotase [Alphaproteobacteria bacterium]|nr:dihydroorotase [Alphaproteobacteria bacterium]HAJ47471.1 dihydroorotase [Alphaproteobacteria bacterium]